MEGISNYSADATPCRIVQIIETRRQRTIGNRGSGCFRRRRRCPPSLALPRCRRKRARIGVAGREGSVWKRSIEKLQGPIGQSV